MRTPVRRLPWTLARDDFQKSRISEAVGCRLTLHWMPKWKSRFGREIARLVLERGWRAALTARNMESLTEFASLYGGRVLVLRLDVNDQALIERAVKDAEAHCGQIDVLVNNAGYGYFSAIEEGEDIEIRRQFETNVFGLVALTRRVLPVMRERHRGHIFNFSSIGGLMAFPALGYYNATKFAVVAISEALAQEVAPLGIKVTIVEPGGFRTDWAGRSVSGVSAQKTPRQPMIPPR